jgi:hypothetical protein
MKDVTIIIPQARGAVPELWEALGGAAVNVEAALSFARENHRVVHVVVEDDVADRTTASVVDAGYMVVDVRDVLIVPLEDRPGALGEVTRKAEEVGAGIYLLSMATGNRVMLGAADLDAAKQAFGL